MIRMFFFLSFAVALTSFAGAQKTTFPDAISFNDYLVNQQLAIYGELNKFTNAIEMGESDEVIWERYNNLVTFTDKVLADLDNIVAYEEGSKLYDSFRSLIWFYTDIFKTDYKRMTEIIVSDVISDEDQTELQNILTNIEEREALYDKSFLTAQENFAAYHGFTLAPAEDY